jgi:hypothetical protein
MLTRPPDEVPVNDPELTLRTMLERAGLQGFLPQHPIELGRPLGTTVPDFFYESRNTDIYAGLCIYLDGMSQRLHGRPETRQRDREIRGELRNHRDTKSLRSSTGNFPTATRWRSISSASLASCWGVTLHNA